MHSVTRAVMVVMVGHVGTLGDNRRGDGEAWRIIIFIPLGYALYEYRHEYCDKQKKYYREHNTEHSEARKKSHTAHF